MKKNISETLFTILIFIPVLSFFLGFILNEYSTGMGDYAGDTSWIKRNIDIFLNNSLTEAINHPDLFGNRTPIVYVIHKIFNPFFGDFEKYRITVFLISLSGPLFLFKLLNLKFQNIDKKILFLIASLLYLSPYYRTSGFWGLNENYAIITFIISFIFLEKFLKNETYKSNSSFLNLILTIIFSSLSVYFDQKFLFVPLLCFIRILFSVNKSSLKINTCFLYFIFSLPYMYFIYKWKGIVPVATQIANPNTITSIQDLPNLYYIHIGYASTIMSFYLLPVILFFKNNIFNVLTNVLKKKSLYYFIAIFLIYIFYHYYFFDFQKFTVKDYWVGLGVVHKLSLIITDNILYQEILTYFFFFFSFLIILIFYYEKKSDLWFLIYFYFISLLLWPLMQEYFDPVIVLSAFILFNSVKTITRFNSIFITAYLSIFLIIANLYYS